MNRNRNANTLMDLSSAATLALVVLATGCATDSGWLSSGGPLAVRPSLADDSAATDESSSQTHLVGYQRQSDIGGISILRSDESLEDRLRQAGGNAVVDFYADWCGPCKALGARLKKLEPTAKQQGVTVIKVNIDRHPELARQYNVSGVPTMLRIRDGLVAERRSGAMAEDQLKQWLIR
jgi:thioredoxin 1